MTGKALLVLRPHFRWRQARYPRVSAPADQGVLCGTAGASYTWAGPGGEVRNQGCHWHLLLVNRIRGRDSNTRKGMRPQSAGAGKFGEKIMGIIITSMKAAASLRYQFAIKQTPSPRYNSVSLQRACCYFYSFFGFIVIVYCCSCGFGLSLLFLSASPLFLLCFARLL